MPPVSLPDSLTKPFKAYSDIVGLELGAGLEGGGVPAVRLRRNKGRTELVAAGFLDLPGALPMAPGGGDVPTAAVPLQGAARGLGRALAACLPAPFGRRPGRG